MKIKQMYVYKKDYLQGHGGNRPWSNHKARKGNRPQHIVVHNTSNTARAWNEAYWATRNPSNKTPNTFHAVVDENEVYEILPFEHVANHAGNRAFNEKSIGVEIARSRASQSLYDQAEKNAAKYIAMILDKYGWSVNRHRIKFHREIANTACPEKIPASRYGVFLAMIQRELDKIQGKTKPKPQAPQNKPQTETVGDIKVGSTVTLNGPVYSTSNKTGKGMTFKNKKGKITIINEGAKAPYHFESLGWVTADSIGAKKAKPKPKPKPKPESSGDIKVGDTVIANGRLYSNSGCGGPGASIKNRKGKITIVQKGACAPYHFEKLGWMKASSIKKQSNTGSKTPSTIKKGDTVKVKSGSKDLNTNRKLDSWVYNTKLKVSEVQNRGYVLVNNSGAVITVVSKDSVVKA